VGKQNRDDGKSRKEDLIDVVAQVTLGNDGRRTFKVLSNNFIEYNIIINTKWSVKMIMTIVF